MCPYPGLSKVPVEVGALEAGQGVYGEPGGGARNPGPTGAQGPQRSAHTQKK